MLMFRRNKGILSANNMATLLWDITADAAQYFYTFPSLAQFKIIPLEGMSTSNLSVQRSLFSENIHILSMDTPQRWLALPTPSLPPMNDLGLTRTHKQTVNKSRRVAATTAVLVVASLGNSGRGHSISWGNERDRDGKDKCRESIDIQVRNLNIHPVLENMMKQVLDA